MAPYLLLKDIFCFPLYIYPLSIVVGLILFYIILKILNCFNDVSQDSKQTKKEVELEKKQTLKHLQNLTPLPFDIIDIIVNQYIIFDNEDKYRIWNRLNKKLELKSQLIINFMMIYTIIGVTLYVLCFGIIAYELYLYTQKDPEYSSWKGFQSYIVTILVCHPFWKMVNWTTSLYTIFKKKDHDGMIFRCYVYYILFPYFLMVFAFGVPALFTMIIPAAIVFIPIPVVVGCCGCWGIVLFCFNFIDYTEFSEQSFLAIIGGICYVIIYTSAVITVPMIWYFYTGEHWVDSFIYGLTSQYCPNTTVDFTDWKSIVFFVCWLL